MFGSGTGAVVQNVTADATFVVGMSQGEGSSQDKTDKNIGDKRLDEIKGGDHKRNTKNERHNYTVSLRNQKR